MRKIEGPCLGRIGSKIGMMDLNAVPNQSLGNSTKTTPRINAEAWLITAKYLNCRIRSQEGRKGMQGTYREVHKEDLRAAGENQTIAKTKSQARPGSIYSYT